MRIIYPYNEILPTRKAHDVYVFQQCASFAESGIDTTLLIGSGSLCDEALCQHYLMRPKPQKLRIVRLPIVRKNNYINLSWNLVFFHFAQKMIERERPDWVIMSVVKQADFHLKRKIASVRYVYEVHELNHYPGLDFTKNYYVEKAMLSKVDLIITTTAELKRLLQSETYQVLAPIEIVPLAVNRKPLKTIDPELPIRLCYVGQLYQQQGLKVLMEAVSQLKDIQLKVVGGNAEEIEHFKRIAEVLKLSDRVNFTGFLSPSQIDSTVADTHVFISAFENEGRMPYVAHTKLLEYSEWKRPFIAPNLPSVREHFGKQEDGALLFSPENPDSLTRVLEYASKQEVLKSLLFHALCRSKSFSWDTRVGQYFQTLQQHAD